MKESIKTKEKSWGKKVNRKKAKHDKNDFIYMFNPLGTRLVLSTSGKTIPASLLSPLLDWSDLMQRELPKGLV